MKERFLKAVRRKGKKGFTLIEILIAIIVILIVVGAFVVKGYRTISTSQVSAISNFISTVENAYTSLANNPLCPAPADKTSFRNEASDSQCRPNTTDHKGDYELPDKISGKWDWNIETSGSSVYLVIDNVDASRGNEVVKIHTECTYSNNKIKCPLGILPNNS